MSVGLLAMSDFAMLDLAVLDKDAAQLLDDGEQRFTTLLDKNAAQQYAERADITAEGKILGGIGGARSQLNEPAALVVIAPTSAPKGRVTHVQS